jgi:hypothetical protein
LQKLQEYFEGKNINMHDATHFLMNGGLVTHEFYQCLSKRGMTE